MTEPLSPFSADEAIVKLLRLANGILHTCASPGSFGPEAPSALSLPPVVRAVYGRQVSADDLVAQVEQGFGDASHVLETSLAMAEVIELALTGQDPNSALMDDASFRDFVVNSKFRAGWVYVAGGQAIERDALLSRLKSQGFDTFAANRPTSVALFVEMVARYAFIYGRCSDGDVHQMSHFVEQNVPAAVVALGPLDALDTFLILGAMRFGIPAIVANDFTYPFGYQVRIDQPEQAASALMSLTNMHVKTRNGGAFSLPSFMNPGNIGQEFEAAVTIGGTATSHLDVERSGNSGARTGSTVNLDPEAAGKHDLHLSEYGGRSIGITVSASNDALDAALLSYVESFALRSLNYIAGVNAEARNGRLTLKLSQIGRASCRVRV